MIPCLKEKELRNLLEKLQVLNNLTVYFLNDKFKFKTFLKEFRFYKNDFLCSSSKLHSMKYIAYVFTDKEGLVEFEFHIDEYLSKKTMPVFNWTIKNKYIKPSRVTRIKFMNDQWFTLNYDAGNFSTEPIDAKNIYKIVTNSLSQPSLVKKIVKKIMH